MATLSITHLFRQILKIPVNASFNDLFVSILKPICAIKPAQVGVRLVGLFNIPACCSYIDIWNTTKDIKHPFFVGNMFLDRFSACYRCPFQNRIGLHCKEIGRVQVISRSWRAAQQRRGNNSRTQAPSYADRGV